MYVCTYAYAYTLTLLDEVTGDGCHGHAAVLQLGSAPVLEALLIDAGGEACRDATCVCVYMCLYVFICVYMCIHELSDDKCHAT